MEADKRALEINTYYLTYYETLFDVPPGHVAMNQHYRKLITGFMKEHPELHTTKEQAMQKENAPDWEDIEERFPLRFVEDGERVYDLWAEYIVLPGDLFYDPLFAYTLKNYLLRNIEKFLNYQLSQYYEDDVTEFCKALKFILREYGEAQSLIPVTTIKTVLEWMAERQQQGKTLNGSGEDAEKVRTRYDGKTKLSVQQTALLYHFLRKCEILRDGLQSSDIAKALHILTGFSVQSLRENLVHVNPKNPTELPERLKRIATEENVSKVYNKLTRLHFLINEAYPQTKEK